MSWVWPNFVASFWLSGAWAGWHLAWNLADFERLWNSAPGRYGARAVVWPAVTAGLQLIIWIFVY